LQSAWDELQKRILAMYTLEEERLMFDAITRGASIEEALESYREKAQQKDSQNDIEFF